MEKGQKPHIQELLSLANGLAVGRIDLTLDDIRGVGPLRQIGDGLIGELGLRELL